MFDGFWYHFSTHFGFVCNKICRLPKKSLGEKSCVPGPFWGVYFQKTQTPNLSSMICNLRNAISCTKRRSSKMGGGGNRAAWRIQIDRSESRDSDIRHNYTATDICGTKWGVTWPAWRHKWRRRADRIYQVYIEIWAGPRLDCTNRGGGDYNVNIRCWQLSLASPPNATNFVPRHRHEIRGSRNKNVVSVRKLWKNWEIRLWPKNGFEFLDFQTYFYKKG